VAGGVAWGVAGGVAGGVVLGMAGGVALGMALGLALGMALGVDWGVALGVAWDSALMRVWTGLAQLPLYLIEAAIQAVLYGVQTQLQRFTLPLSPVLYHELIYFPLPFLADHIVLGAQTDPAIARSVLEAGSIAPGTRRAGEIALARLQARELETLARSGRFRDAMELNGEWLPSIGVAPPLLLGFVDAARYLLAASEASIAYHRLDHVKRAEDKLRAIGSDLLVDRAPLGQALRETLRVWQDSASEIRRKAELAAQGELVNPFLAGPPLTPEQGRAVFRGREPLIAQIEALLADPRGSHSIALLGPRRCGKTSLLNMLPVMLPDTQCVFFDLQDNPASSAAAFFNALAGQAQVQARRDRRVTIPPLPDGPPIESAAVWFKSLEEGAGNNRVLIAIDEFERLEEIFGGDRRELVAIMGLFRATIQHRRKVRLLVSGVAPFDELGPIWDDHFINVREIRIGHLDQDVACGLLTQPAPEFPLGAIPPDVARAIFDRTGGQPYLLQLYGSILVSRLNDRKRRLATREDLPAVEDQVLTQARAYFSYTIKAAPAAARTVIEALARGETPNIDEHTRRWLERRCLITPEGQLRIPVLGAWVREEVLV
jgi:hypothetical protein